MARGQRARALVGCIVLGLAACRSSLPQPGPAPIAGAQEAMAHARQGLRVHAPYADVRDSLERAVELAPDWEVPRRLLDDLRTGRLMGPRVLREHWAALDAGENVAMHAYLSGRLEREDGTARFTEARIAAPQGPWALHGLAFAMAGRGRVQRAIALQAQALALSREPVERVLFASALARYQRAAGDPKSALRVLRGVWQGLPPGPARHGVEVQVAAMEVAIGGDALLRRATARVERLLRSGDITDRELNALLDLGVVEGAVARAWLLLRPDFGRGEQAWSRDLSLRLLGASDRSPLALHVAAGGTEPSRIVALFGQGRVAEAWRLWQQGLPTVLTRPGSQRPRLSDLGAALTAWSEGPDGEGCASALGEALLHAGWFKEARAFARGMPKGMPLEEALVVEAHATLALASLRGLSGLMGDVDAGRARLAPTERDGIDDSVHDRAHDRAYQRGTAVTDLDGLLRATGRILWAAGPYYFEGLDRSALEARVLASPRLKFGPFAQVVHPGPQLAPWDRGRALGDEGDPVPGLAWALGRLGRVGIFGEAVGEGAPDASVLRLVQSSRVQGMHLGVPFHGTVLWSDGADVGARGVRAGASVSGGALHEGYFVDLLEVRRSHRRWQDLADRFADGSLRIAEVLDDPGLPVEVPVLLDVPMEPADLPGLDLRAHRVEPWLRVSPLLGQADRNRLAWMLERAAHEGSPAGSLSAPSLDEVTQLTSIHEEGHLCERTRFLPLRHHWTRALAFLADQGFSSRRIQERLEYRAQLTALCEVPDPRLVLIDILDQAEGSAVGLPHGVAYGILLDDILAVLCEGYRGDADWARGLSLDLDHRLVFQLHRIPGEVYRAVALILAEREGLLGT